MKRIIVCILIMMLMMMNLSRIKVQAAPVALAATASTVTAMIIGLIPYLGVLFGIESDRQKLQDSVETLVSDEMAKTNAGVRALAPYTSENDATASNGTILQNYLNDNAVIMAMQADSGRNYVQTYFTGVGQSQLFVKAVLAMSAAMLADENLETYTELTEGEATGYQKWMGYPDNTILSINYPYQLITSEYSGTQVRLYISKYPIYHNDSRLYCSNGSNMKLAEYINSGWSFYEFSLAYETHYQDLIILQANYDIYADSGLSSIYFEKNTTATQDAGITEVETQVFENLLTQLPYQQTYIWDDTATIAVPGIETALDVMEGTKTIAEVMDTYTAEDAITMTKSIADTMAGTVAEPSTTTWSKENWTVPAIIITKFPFCLPWDVMAMFQSFIADPVAPVWTIDLSEAYPDLIFNIDMQPFEPLAKILRFFVYATFLLALAMNTKRIIPTLG